MTSGPALSQSAPLRAVALICLVVLGLTLSMVPWTGFVTVDMGGNYIQAVGLATTGRPDIPIGPLLRPVVREYFPWRYSSTEVGPIEDWGDLRSGWLVEHDGRFSIVYPIAMAALGAAGYLLAGTVGLFIVPLLGGVLAVWATGRLAQRLGVRRAWVPALIVGLGSPMALYSVLCWGHAPAAAAATVAFGLLARCLAADSSAPGSHWSAFLGGLAFGAAAVLRNEGLLLAVIALLVLGSLGGRAGRRAVPLIFLGLALAHGPTLAYNWTTFKSPVDANQASRATVFRPITESGGLRIRAMVTQAGHTLVESLLTSDNLRPQAQRVVNALLAVALLGWILMIWRPTSRIGLHVGGGLSFTVSLAYLAFALAVRPQLVPGAVLCTPLLLVGVATALAPAPGLWWKAPEKRVVVVTSILFILAASIRGSPGWQWGGRYLLVVQPVLVIMAVRGLEFLEERNECAALARLNLVLLATLGFAMSWVSIRDLVSEQAFRQNVEQRVVRSMGSRAVAFDHWWFSWENAPLAYDKELFFVDTPERLERLGRHLGGAGENRLVLVTRCDTVGLKRYIEAAARTGLRVIDRRDAALPYGLQWHALAFERQANAGPR